MMNKEQCISCGGGGSAAHPDRIVIHDLSLSETPGP